LTQTFKRRSLSYLPKHSGGQKMVIISPEDQKAWDTTWTHPDSTDRIGKRRTLQRKKFPQRRFKECSQVNSLE